MTLFSLLILILVVCLVGWVITLLPIPPAMPWLRNVLFILLAIVCIVWLLDLGGIADIGLYRRFR